MFFGEKSKLSFFQAKNPPSINLPKFCYHFSVCANYEIATSMNGLISNGVDQLVIRGIKGSNNNLPIRYLFELKRMFSAACKSKL